MKFELLSTWGGWDQTTIPDNLEIEFQTDESAQRFQASLRDICFIYGLTANRTTGDTVIGTGTYVELSEDDDGNVIFDLSPIRVKTNYAELESELESLLRLIFEQQDRRDSSATRSEQLRHLEEWLSARNIACDVSELYLRISREGE